jgi:hypothetical protein
MMDIIHTTYMGANGLTCCPEDSIVDKRLTRMEITRAAKNTPATACFKAAMGISI